MCIYYNFLSGAPTPRSTADASSLRPLSRYFKSNSVFWVPVLQWIMQRQDHLPPTHPGQHVG